MSDTKNVINQIVLNDMRSIFSFDYSVSRIMTSLEESTIIIDVFINSDSIGSSQIKELMNKNYKINYVQSMNKLDNLRRYINHNDNVRVNNYLIICLETNFNELLEKHKSEIDELIDLFDVHNFNTEKIKESIENYIIESVFSNTITKEHIRFNQRLVNSKVYIDHDLNKVIFEYNIYDSGTYIYDDSTIYRIKDHVRNSIKKEITVSSVEINEKCLIFIIG